MSGVKGRSGRRSLKDWEKRLRIIDKAWDAIEAYLDDKEIPLKNRAWLAKNVVIKDMPDKLTDGDGDPLPVPVINIYGTNGRNKDVCTAESDRST